jgi:hypothetical protein
MTRATILLSALLVSFTASGHHSIGAFYDYDNPRELEGTITNIRWINPHVRFTLETLNENNETESWQLESGSVNMLERQGVARGVVELGDRITVAGYASRHGRKDMIAGYITLPDGESVVLWSGLFGGLATTAPPRETQLRVSGDAEAAAAAAEGMFRVWTMGETYSRDTTDEGGTMEVPYLATAIAAREAYDPITDDTALQCIQQGMPGIMDNPFPIELFEQDGDIILRTEEWDVVRTFHMSGDAAAAGQPATPHGYSVGRWEGDTLVVSTTRIDWPFFDDIGTPQGAAVETLERFELSDDETRLNYTLTVTDAETFTTPFTLDGHWKWVPGEIIKPYNCAL